MAAPVTSTRPVDSSGVKCEATTCKSMTTLRRLQIETGVIDRSDGSACFSHGQTSVAAGVNGPVDVRIQKELIDRAFIDVNFRRKSGMPGCLEKTIETFLHQIFNQIILVHQHPRTAFELNVQELHNDGCLVSCAVNSTCMALLDAGIPMKDVVAAVTCCISSNGNIIIDPLASDLSDSKASLTVVVEAKTKSILALTTEGMFTTAQLNDSIKRCAQTSETVFEHYLKYVKTQAQS